MRDDTWYEDDDVKEAVRRLPEHLYNERMFRIKRALDLSLKHQILPKDQWVKYEEVCVQNFTEFFCKKAKTVAQSHRRLFVFRQNISPKLSDKGIYCN